MAKSRGNEREHKKIVGGSLPCKKQWLVPQSTSRADTSVVERGVEREGLRGGAEISILP